MEIVMGGKTWIKQETLTWVAVYSVDCYLEIRSKEDLNYDSTLNVRVDYLDEAHIDLLRHGYGLDYMFHAFGLWMK